MNIFKALRKADEEKDIDAYMSYHHEDFEFVRHQTGTTMNKTELRVLVLGMMAHPSFQDGSRESVLIVKMIENGQIIRSESGATPMK